MIFNEICRLSEFEKDIKKLGKKFRTIEGDLENFIKTELKIYHKLGKNIKGIVKISDLGIKNPSIYKATRFACRALKGSGSRSGIRVIYAHFEKDDKIELIEIYYKGNKNNEDRERIKRNYKYRKLNK